MKPIKKEVGGNKIMQCISAKNTNLCEKDKQIKTELYTMFNQVCLMYT